MASIIRCISLLIFCAVVVANEPSESDKKLMLDLISVLSGSWSNKEQIAAGSKEHDLIQGYIRQVEMPALKDKHLLFVEHAVNGKVVILKVVDITVDEKDKNLLYLRPYEFADPRKYKPREFNIEDLRNLTVDQLRYDPDCVDNLVKMSDGVYSGICSLCKINIGGRHPGFAVTLTCDECTGAIPLSVRAKASSIPYIFRLDGDKFQPINAPAHYVNPCDKKLSGMSNTTQGYSTDFTTVA